MSKAICQLNETVDSAKDAYRYIDNTNENKMEAVISGRYRS